MGRSNLPHSRLIVLDGLPGSGKSTTGQWLTSQLQEHGLNTRWLPEADVSHPLWWYEHWNGTDYQLPDFENTQSKCLCKQASENGKILLP